MTTPITRRAWLAGMTAAAALPAPLAWSADTWPTAPVKLVLPFTPGGSDLLFRMLGPKLAEKWKQPVVIEYKPGASNIVATSFIVKAKPDGHTIGVTGATVATNPLFYKDLPYTFNDMRGISRLVDIDMVLVARNGAPFSTLPEMVAYAKSNPGKLSWGTGGLGATYAGFLRLLNAAGIDMLHVNYQGTPQAHNELMADRIDVVVNPHAASLPFVQAKRMKIIAACGPRRIEGFEKIAAVNETFPGVEITPYYALIAPRDTPTAIVRKIQADAAAVLNEPAFKEKIRELGLVVNITDPEQTDAAFRSETLEWARIAARIKLPPP